MDFIKKDILVDNKEFYSIELDLGKTTFILVGNKIGFIMCGALNVDIYNTPKMKDRKVVCANVLGVKSVEDLLNARLNKVSDAAGMIGFKEGMSVHEALSLLA